MEQPARDAMMERLDPFVGAWSLEAVFPNKPTEVLRGGRSVFEWMKGRQILIQRTMAPVPEVPDSIAVVACDPEKAMYVQHYFDSRGVVRLYAMTYRDGVWTLVRASPDFTPLPFAQRYIATFDDHDATIHGTWEKSDDGSHWQKDFDLTYRRIT
jgi:hypothetical protein